MKLVDNNYRMQQKGFTLVEVLVVVGIVGVLSTAAFAILNPSGQLQKARDSKRKADIATLQAGLELYRSDNNAYPTSLTFCNNSSLSVGGVTYIKTIPCDPKNTGQMIYRYVPSGSPASSYELIICLENASDPQKDNPNRATYCAATNPSYTVTNP